VVGKCQRTTVHYADAILNVTELQFRSAEALLATCAGDLRLPLPSGWYEPRGMRGKSGQLPLLRAPPTRPHARPWPIASTSPETATRPTLQQTTTPADSSTRPSSPRSTSTTTTTNGAGNVDATYAYDTWGNTTSSSGTFATTNPYRYATGYTDANGLIKLGTRYYNGTTARFTQQDPAQQGSNLYAYAGDNPVNSNDPSGKSILGDIGSAFSSVAGSVRNFV
jgi:RHS repeat-associated protein